MSFHTFSEICISLIYAAGFEELQVFCFWTPPRCIRVVVRRCRACFFLPCCLSTDFGRAWRKWGLQVRAQSPPAAPPPPSPPRVPWPPLNPGFGCEDDPFWFVVRNSPSNCTRRSAANGLRPTTLDARGTPTAARGARAATHAARVRPKALIRPSPLRGGARALMAPSSFQAFEL